MKDTAGMQDLVAFDAGVSGWIHFVGICIEVFGVFIIVAGIIWSTFACVFSCVECRNL